MFFFYSSSDSSASGVGKFSFIEENPIKTYDLEFVSKYACPVGPAPPPPSEATCCLYLLNRDPAVAKTLCSSHCPTSLADYKYAGNWTVTTCDSCFFHKK
jgi:hypothetical protein